MAPRIPEIAPNDDTLTAALSYAAAGWYIVPIRRGSKHPGSVVGSGWQYQSSRDPEMLAAWFAGADHGLALHAGRSGAIVADVDHPDRLPDPLASAIQDQAPPHQSTRASEPGRGHYLFAVPPGRTLGNGTGKLGGGWGELRGTNGIAVVAPSVHENTADGGRYAWVNTGPVPVLPEAVAELLHDAGGGEDAASDKEVLAFLDTHTGNRRPELLDAWVSIFEQKIAQGESRHQRMISVAAGAMSEARAGYFPARQAMERLEQAFLDAVTKEPVPGSQQGSARGSGMAKSEWMGISAWGVGQADAADLGDIHARVNEKMPDGNDLSWIPNQAPPGVDPDTGEVLDGGGSSEQPPRRPDIDCSNEPDAIRKIVKILQHNAFLPGLYVRAGRLVSIEDVPADSDSSIVIEELREDKLRRLLADHANCYKVVKRGDDFVPVPALPALATSRAALKSTDWGKVPPLTGVVHTPVLRHDGSVLQDPGYDPATGLYLCNEVTMPPVSDQPPAEDIAASRHLLLDQVLADFPWVADADRANFIALLFTPLLRPYTRGLSPLGAISAPERGAGKTLLADIIMSLYGGVMRTMSDNDEEMRKAITAVLRGTEPVVIFDNVPARSTVESPSLAQALTNRKWSDRLLGFNENAELANDRLWLATGTNIKLGGDFAQRTTLVRIDPEQPRPDRREDFALDPLDEWVQDNRGHFLHALFVLARAWIAAGAPRAKGLRMRNFTKWAAALGGLLNFHGIDGFLANRDEIDTRDEDTEVWSAFLASWYTRYGDVEQRVTTLRADAEASYYAGGASGWSDAFPRSSRDDKPVAAKTLSAMLQERNGRFYGEFRLHGRWDRHRKAWFWCVTPYIDESGATWDFAGHAGDHEPSAGHFQEAKTGDDQQRCGSRGSAGDSSTYTNTYAHTRAHAGRNERGERSPASPAPSAKPQVSPAGDVEQSPASSASTDARDSNPNSCTCGWGLGTVGCTCTEGGST